MMLYPASHWLGGLPQWSTDEEDVNGSGISESDMRAVRAQAARCRQQSPEAGADERPRVAPPAGNTTRAP